MMSPKRPALTIYGLGSVKFENILRKMSLSCCWVSIWLLFFSYYGHVIGTQGTTLYFDHFEAFLRHIKHTKLNESNDFYFWVFLHIEYDPLVSFRIVCVYINNFLVSFAPKRTVRIAWCTAHNIEYLYCWKKCSLGTDRFGSNSFILMEMYRERFIQSFMQHNFAVKNIDLEINIII